MKWITSQKKRSGNVIWSNGSFGAAGSHGQKKSLKLCKYISKLITTDKQLTANNINILQTCEISN